MVEMFLELLLLVAAAAADAAADGGVDVYLLPGLLFFVMCFLFYSCFFLFLLL